MKRILILALFVSGAAYGQNLKSDSLLQLLPGDALKGNLFPDISNNELLQNQKIFLFKDKDENEMGGLMADGNATFSHKTSLGSIFILSEDGMACLIPDLQKVERMPRQGFGDTQNADRMPNAFPKQKILMIPRK